MLQCFSRIPSRMSLAVLVLVSGCLETDIPPAGSYSEVLLVTEAGAQDPFARELTPYLAKTIDYYIDRDIQFKIENVKAADMEVVPYVKNIVFCGVVSPISDVGRRISTLLGPAGVEKVALGKAHIFRKEDLPGPGQTTMIVSAQSEEALYRVIAERGDDVTDALEASCRARLRKYLLQDSKTGLTQRLNQKYGFTVEVPGFYDLNSDELDPPGIELLRQGPPRSLGIFWVDRATAPTLKDRQDLFDIRARYVFSRYDGDVMDSTRVAFSVDRLGDLPAIKMSGYWSNSNALAGGYYETYFIFEEAERLLWVVDLLVYAPGLPKHPHFRELLAIAETFRY